MSFPTNQQLFFTESKATLSLSAPYVASRLLNALNWFVGMAIIACLGKEAVAAGVLLYTTVLTIQLTVWALMYSVAVVVGRAYGAKNFIEVGRIVQYGCILAFFVGVPISILMWHVDVILTALKQPFDLVIMLRPYFHIMAFSILPSLWFMVFIKFAIGILRSRLVLVAMLFATPVNLLLTYGLVLGKFGMPMLGITGAAWGSVVMYWGLVLGLGIYFYIQKDFFIYRLFNKIKKIDWSYIKQLFRIGWPISVEWGAMMLTYTLQTYMLGWLGTQVLAAHQVATQCVNLVIMVPYSMAHATAVLVAQRLGAKQYRALKTVGYAGMLLAAMLVFLGSLFYWLFPKILISVYLHMQDVNNMAIISLAIVLLALMGINQLTDSIVSMANGALRGFQDTRTPMLIAVGSNWLVSISLCYVLGFTLHLGAIGIYLAFIIGSALSATWLVLRFRNKCLFMEKHHTYVRT
jgi:multidrug resistance protein, MATE family